MLSDLQVAMVDLLAHVQTVEMDSIVESQVTVALCSVGDLVESVESSQLFLSAKVAEFRAEAVDEKLRNCRLEQMLWNGHQRKAVIFTVLDESDRAYQEALGECSDLTNQLKFALEQKSDLELQVMDSVMMFSVDAVLSELAAVARSQCLLRVCIPRAQVQAAGCSEGGHGHARDLPCS
jgi:hypothetical protein